MLGGMFQKEERLAFPNATVVHVVVVNECRYLGLLEALWIENKKRFLTKTIKSGGKGLSHLFMLGWVLSD